MSKGLFCTHPPSSTNFLAACRCFSVHSPTVFFGQQRQSWLQPSTLLQLFTFMLCCPLLPIDCSGLLQKIFSLHPLGKHISYPRFYRLQIPRYANAATYLPPHLNFSNLSHPSFSLFMMPFSGPDSFCPALSGQGGKFFLYFEAICVHEQGQRSCALFARCCCICLLNVNLSVRAITTACAPHVLAGTMPARNNFVTPTFM